MDERRSGAMSIRGGQIWNRMANFRGLEGAREGIGFGCKVLTFWFVFFFFVFRLQLQWRCSLNKWNPSTKIDWCDFGTLHEPKWRRWSQQAIDVGCSLRTIHFYCDWPPFVRCVAVVARSTAFYMFCASKVIENNNWRCQRGGFGSFYSPARHWTPTTCI